MNFAEEVNRFRFLEVDRIKMFAPPREMEKAVDSYNRAVQSIRANNFDIALIGIRRIVKRYPLFAFAHHLYALLLAQSGNAIEAKKELENILLLDISNGERQLVQYHLKEIKVLAKKQREIEMEEERQAQIIEPVSSYFASSMFKKEKKKKNSIDIASAAEREEILRTGDYQTDLDDEIIGAPALHKNKQQKDRVKRFLLIILLFVFIVLVVLIIKSCMQGENQLNEKTTADKKLEWIVSYLKESGDEVKSKQALQEYNAWLKLPEGQDLTEKGIANENTGNEGDANKLKEIAADFDLIDDYIPGNWAEAAELIIKCKTNLETLADDVSVIGVVGNAGEYKQKLQDLLLNQGEEGAKVLYNMANSSFNAQDYKKALSLYQFSYQLAPDKLSGLHLYQCAMTEIQLKKYDEARENFNKVIAEFPSHDIAASAKKELQALPK